MHVFFMTMNISNKRTLGHSMTLLTHEAEHTLIRKAAELLHVSRLFLIKLLKGRQIKFHKNNSHRKISVKTVLDFKRK